jgi:hypothetical protein
VRCGGVARAKEFHEDNVEMIVYPEESRIGSFVKLSVNGRLVVALSHCVIILVLDNGCRALLGYNLEFSCDRKIIR